MDNAQNKHPVARSGQITRAIGNISNSLLDSLFIQYEIDQTPTIEILKVINECKSKFTNGLSTINANYWIERGYSSLDAKILQHKCKRAQKGLNAVRKSAFQFKTYLEKINPNTGILYTLEEAKYKANQIRPIRPEYWMEKLGVDYATALDHATKTKQRNNHAGQRASANKSNEQKIGDNNTRPEFYMIRYGLTFEESVQCVADRQRTFTLDSCIDKHGAERGPLIWKARQDKWLATLDQKPAEEKARISEMRNTMSALSMQIRYGDDEAAKESYRQKFRNRLRLYNKDNFINLYGVNARTEYAKFVKTRPNSVHFKFLEFSKLCAHIKVTLLSDGELNGVMLNIIPDETYWYHNTNLDKLIIDVFGEQKHIKTIVPQNNGNFKNYECSVIHNGRKKRLRSKLEMRFYHMLCAAGVEFEIEKIYPGVKRQKCDFYIPQTDDYIEICGMMKKQAYKQKMELKRSIHGAILLETDDEMSEYVDRLCEL